MSKISDLYLLGQSIWLDFINRSFIASGNLQKLVDLGVSGVTSNPTIFEKSITSTSDYDQDIKSLMKERKTSSEIFLALAIKDIQLAADVLHPVYVKSHRKDGYVSLEVNPLLAYNTPETIQEAFHVWELVDRPNLMIKIPATTEGLPAITAGIRNGININVTLIFSINRYREVIDAYFSGLEARIGDGKEINHIHSVASFFVSRLDTKVDKLLLEKSQNPGLIVDDLMGKTAISNTKLAYQLFQQEYNSNRFRKLQNHGANKQRPLWASTSTKNPNYPDILYVQELIAQDTVNTIPLETIDLFLDHGEARISIEDQLQEAMRTINQLQNLGIVLSDVTQELENEGVTAFSKSYRSLLDSLEKKMTTFK